MLRVGGFVDADAGQNVSTERQNKGDRNESIPEAAHSGRDTQSCIWCRSDASRLYVTRGRQIQGSQDRIGCKHDGELSFGGGPGEQKASRRAIDIGHTTLYRASGLLRAGND